MYELEDFIKQCAVTVTGTSLFQNYTKPPINVFKLPLILSQTLAGQVRNRESLKKSNFLFEFDLSLVDLNLVAEIFSQDLVLMKKSSMWIRR